MAFIAINMGNRLIDKLAPQEHREVSRQQAEVYKKLLPREIKIIENNEPSQTLEEVKVEVEIPALTPTEDVQPPVVDVQPPTEDVQPPVTDGFVSINDIQNNDDGIF